MKIFIIVFILLFILSCSKDEPAVKTKTQLLTETQWKYEAGGIDIDKNGVIDIPIEQTGMIPPCALDNLGSFRANGTGVNFEGATKCDPSLPDSTFFNWAFTNNESRINITGSAFAGISGEFVIKELSANRFTISKDTTISPWNAAIIVSLKH